MTTEFDKVIADHEALLARAKPQSRPPIEASLAKLKAARDRKLQAQAKSAK